MVIVTKKLISNLIVEKKTTHFCITISLLFWVLVLQNTIHAKRMFYHQAADLTQHLQLSWDRNAEGSHNCKPSLSLTKG